MRIFMQFLLLLIFATAFGKAEAAESYDNCAGFIDSIPTTISTQGVWCLRKDLSGNLGSGAAVTIAANNITIDCNDYKLGNLAAGPATLARGISAQDRANPTIRHCNVRGFATGIDLTGSGALVEGNRLDGNTRIGIRVSGDGGVVRDNLVFDTGSATGYGIAIGIQTDFAVDVLDNRASAVLALVPANGTGRAVGIWLGENATGLVAHNRISQITYQFLGNGSVSFWGIESYATGYPGQTLRINDNVAPSYVIGCPSSSNTRVRGNNASIIYCVDDGNFL